MTKEAICRLGAIAVGLAISTALLGGCAHGGRSINRATHSPGFPVPLATSIQTSEGTWATVAMGHLDDPLNSFWQLLYRPGQASSWSNQVEATATATNGGLVLADRGKSQLIVAIRPSNYLHFTPIIATSDAGASWSNGLIDSTITAGASALAASPDGEAGAIVTSRGTSELIASAAGLSSWRVRATASALSARRFGRSCAPTRLTAVAFLGSKLIVGGSCSRAGGTAIYLFGQSQWRMAGPRLTDGRTSPRATVLGFEPAGQGLVALIGLSDGSGSSLVATSTATGNRWDSSDHLTIPKGTKFLSYGPTADGGIFVLLQSADGDEHLYQTDGPDRGWRLLPSPPAATATVAYVGGSSIEALAVHDTVLTVWNLDSFGTWHLIQTMHVPIQFGSSS